MRKNLYKECEDKKCIIGDNTCVNCERFMYKLTPIIGYVECAYNDEDYKQTNKGIKKFKPLSKKKQKQILELFLISSLGNGNISMEVIILFITTFLKKEEDRIDYYSFGHSRYIQRFIPSFNERNCVELYTGEDGWFNILSRFEKIKVLEKLIKNI